MILLPPLAAVFSCFYPRSHALRKPIHGIMRVAGVAMATGTQAVVSLVGVCVCVCVHLCVGVGEYLSEEDVERE